MNSSDPFWPLKLTILFHKETRQDRTPFLPTLALLARVTTTPTLKMVTYSRTTKLGCGF